MFDGRNGERGNKRRSDVINQNPDEAGLVTDRVELVTDEVEPNEFVHYDVNLNKRTCGCAHWQHYGITCMQARSFSVGEVSRTVGGKEWCEDGSR